MVSLHILWFRNCKSYLWVYCQLVVTLGLTYQLWPSPCVQQNVSSYSFGNYAIAEIGKVACSASVLNLSQPGSSVFLLRLECHMIAQQLN